MKKSKTEIKKILWNSIKFLTAGYLIYYLISLTDNQSLIAVINSILTKYLLIVLFFAVIEIIFIGYRFQLLLGKTIPLVKIINLVIFQKSIAAVIATAAGFATYVTGMKTEHDINVGKGVTTFLVAKLGDLFAIVLFLSVSSYFVWSKIEALRFLVVLISLVIVFGFGLLIWGFNNRKKFYSFIEKYFDQFSLSRFKLMTKLKDYIQSLINIEIKKNTKPLLLGAGLSLLIFGSIFFTEYFLNQAFSISIGFWAIMFMVSLKRLISLVPIYVLGGLGVADITSLFLYGLFGFTQVEIAPKVVGLRIIYYVLLLVVFSLIPINNLLFDRKRTKEKKSLELNNE